MSDALKSFDIIENAIKRWPTFEQWLRDREKECIDAGFVPDRFVFQDGSDMPTLIGVKKDDNAI